MEMMEEIRSSKRSRIENGRGGGNAAESAAATKIRHKEQEHQDEDEEDGEGKSSGAGGARLRAAWNHHSSTASRICRVSRASGGKDRHSKVLTSKGLRDRRVRLSVSTAIQFYDLQDRLGYDRPSKAVEWLIKAAASAIAELPSLDGPFPDPTKQLGEEKPREPRLMEDDDPEITQHDYSGQQQQHLSLTKSACSSTSETSKGSVLSLSRSEIRIKARERARKRAAKEKEKEREADDPHIASTTHHHHQNGGMNPNPISQSFFMELLTGGSHHDHGPVTVAQANPGPNFIHKQLRHLPSSTATTDFFGQAGFFRPVQKPHQPTGFPAQTHFGNSSHMGMVPCNVAAAVAAAAAAAAGDHPDMQQQQQFSFMPDHLIPISAAAAAGGDYNPNSAISSGLAGFNRGTLQSNSPSPLPQHHLHRLSSPVDGSNLPFFFGTAATAPSASGESQFPAGFDGRLQLCYGDGHRHSDLKGKGKS